MTTSEDTIIGGIIQVWKLFIVGQSAFEINILITALQMIIQVHAYDFSSRPYLSLSLSDLPSLWSGMHIIILKH